jgi:beta-galactosidase
MAADHTYVIGDFVWTAIDYLGESGIGRWYYDGDTPGEHWTNPMYPWHAAYCGDIDLTGLRKPVSHYRSMLWNPDGEQLYMAVREPDGYRGRVKTTMWGTWPTSQCWNWEGHEGKPIDVEVYSRYPRVRLTLNGQVVGEKPTDQCMATFTLPYQPGELRAEGLADAQPKESTTQPNADAQPAESVTLQTAGKAETIRLTADRPTLKADGQDLVFITVDLLDARGIPHPTAAPELSATVSGPATLAAFGNADIKDCSPLSDARHRAWQGRALLVVRSTAKTGTVTITVRGDQLKPATVKLKAK